MTTENLSEVKIMDDDVVIREIVGMKLSGTQTVENTDGTLTYHFYMNDGEYVEDEYSTAGHILLGEGEE